MIVFLNFRTCKKLFHNGFCILSFICNSCSFFTHLHFGKHLHFSSMFFPLWCHFATSSILITITSISLLCSSIRYSSSSYLLHISHPTIFCKSNDVLVLIILQILLLIFWVLRERRNRKKVRHEMEMKWKEETHTKKMWRN